ncbi:uncharacterized protein K452DRAFT_355756 [Aplosporella prunicola CBS 121167]|uniref:Pre-mRNA-splicing factor 38B n=1 Tax=Aplosporella prunicola CBS 121167 TaxID=1176127 RepID=A0A6A6BSW3_9PEZI|nr:uncharacterized protein K452DRAFT_355756 [Aplosporella prunicola CBS 121167]KAF2146355.1 hypothetical protein K452DRAFT_355756 [Aplosporella prunicola CBS 121167]
MPSENYTDDHVAELLKKDAKASSARYAAVGLQAYLPKRPTGAAPKPNTRFLRNILRETDTHNQALLAKEAEESRARLKALRDKRREYGVEGEQSRSKDGHGAVEHRHRDRDERPAKRRRTDDGDAYSDGDHTRRHDDGHRSRRSRRDRSEDRSERKEKRSRREYGSDDDREDYRSRHSSHRHRSHRHRDRGESEDRSRDRRHASSRKHRHRSRSPDESPERRHTSSRKHRDRSLSEDGDRDRHGSRHRHRRRRSPSSGRSRSVSKDRRRSRREKQSPSASTADAGNSKDGSRKGMTTKRDPPRRRSLSPASDSDPLEAIIGPAPPPPAPKVRGRGRGAFTSSSAMDAHFADNYDPSQDIHPGSDVEDDWDQALEALRDRQRWKQQGAERLKAAGFTEEEVKRWEKGGEKTEEDVRWRKKGEGREWDRGKVVDADGHVDVGADWGRLKGT